MLTLSLWTTLSGFFLKTAADFCFDNPKVENAHTTAIAGKQLPKMSSTNRRESMVKSHFGKKLSFALTPGVCQ
jgi:hypothetical protein